MSATEMMQDGVVGIPEAMRFSGLSRTTLYQEMEAGSLPYTKVGARRLIPLVGLKSLLARGLVGGPPDDAEAPPPPKSARRRPRQSATV